jgi:hypothetical protein
LVGALPVDASISRKGGARWASGEFSYRAWVWKDAAGALAWNLHVGDAKFGTQMSESGYGGLSVAIHSSLKALPWPVAADPLLAEFLREGLGQATSFVADRADLCVLLCSSEDVHRGDLHAWLPIANYPARLVQALILARDLGRDDLESQIRSKLQGDPIPLDFGRSLEIQQSAKRSAAKYSAVLGFEVRI